MGKFSNKAKAKPSKRKTLKQKYKIERKVREFKRKARKTARKMRSSGQKKGGKQALPLPNMFPFKSDVMDAALREKYELEAMKKPPQPQDTIFHDDGKKRFQKLYNMLPFTDIIIYVLDARDPEGTRSKYHYNIVTKEGKNLYFILNKIDLITSYQAIKWQYHLSKIHPTILYRCEQEVKENTILPKSNNLGHGYLYHLIRENFKMSVTIGVIGMPRVGKSAFVRSLANSANISSLTLKSKSLYFLQVSKDVQLLDATFRVQPQNPPFILREVISKEFVEEILKKVKKDTLIELYYIQDFTTTDDFIEKVARSCGKLQKGGKPDDRKAIQLICSDFFRQRIAYSTQCP